MRPARRTVTPDISSIGPSFASRTRVLRRMGAGPSALPAIPAMPNGLNSLGRAGSLNSGNRLLAGKRLAGSAAVVVVVVVGAGAVGGVGGLGLVAITLRGARVPTATVGEIPASLRIFQYSRHQSPRRCRGWRRIHVSMAATASCAGVMLEELDSLLASLVASVTIWRKRAVAQFSGAISDMIEEKS